MFGAAMSFILSILGLGFILGMKHATDPDHVVAVTTIVSKERKIYHSSLIGILWGLGHSITVTAVAIPIMLLSLTVPPEVSLGMEFAVGCMLVTLGVLNFTRFSQKKEHEHFHIIKPLIAGLIHGFAGSAAVALLILSTIKNPQFAAIYLILFNVGVVCGMILITSFLGASINMVKRKSEFINRYLAVGSGILSVIFGIYIMYQTGIEGKLFS